MVKEAKGGVANRVEQHCRQRPVLMTEAQPMPPMEKGVRLRTAPAFINETLKGFRAHHDIFSLGCSFLNEVAGSALVGVFFLKVNGASNPTLNLVTFSPRTCFYPNIILHPSSP